MKRLALLIFFIFALSGIAQAGDMDWLRVDGTAKIHGKTYFYDEIELGGENVSDIVDVIDGTVTHDDLATALAIKNYADSLPGGGDPGGSDGDLQYNNDGSFGGFGHYDDATGYVGIGTESPEVNLSVVDEGKWSAIRSLSYSDTTTDRGYVQIGRADGTEGSPGAVDTDDYLGSYSFLGHTGSNWRTGATISALATENWIEDTGYGTEVRITTAANGETAQATRWKIGSDGKMSLAYGTGVTSIDTVIDGTSTHDDLATALAVKNYADGISGSSPGGTDGKVQYNDGGVFGGDTLHWDDVNKRLGIDVVPGYTLHVRGASDVARAVLQRNSSSSNQDIGYWATVAHDGTPVQNTQIKGRTGATSDSGQIIMYTANTSGTLQEVFRANEYGNIGLSNADPANTYALRVGGATLIDGGTLRCNYGFEMWDQDAWLSVRSDDGSTIQGGLRANNSGYIGLYVGSVTNHPVYFVGNSQVRAHMTSGGNWGLGVLFGLTEKLEVAGAIRVESTSGTKAGTIRWNGSKFQGYTGSAWVDFH